MRDETKAGLGGVGLVLGALLLVFALVAGGFAIKWVTADIRGKGEARELTKANGALRISAYNHFYDLCGAVQAKEDQIKIFQSDTSEQGQVNLRAIEAKRAELIRTYNADASKSYTIGQFKSSHLPYHLDPTEMSTSCE